MNIDGVTGYLSNLGDVDQMAENGIKILKDEDLLETFKENAFTQAQTFSYDAIVPEYEELYNRALALV